MPDHEVFEEIRSLVTELKAYIYLLTDRWSQMSEEERRRLAIFSHEKITELNAHLDPERLGDRNSSVRLDPESARGDAEAGPRTSRAPRRHEH